ncbi:MAG: nitroreductase family protein [candidate division WOR-3 bacterium]|nr:MAG: nitroreductase family protein [candidate division WOR-3 bacterium]
MAGILFLRTKEFETARRFYQDTVGMKVWLEQPDIAILQHGNMLVGLHRRPEPDLEGLLTFFERGREFVDRMYDRLKDVADAAPRENPKYRIYHFFAKDPEGRRLEFQSFLDPVQPFEEGATALATRRSIRQYRPDPVVDETLSRVFELCRYAPSSRNTQPCYFLVVRDQGKVKALAGVRGRSSAPIGRARLAVAVVSDPEKSGRHVEDGCIMAYHFVLAAWMHGLGTCWIGGMDRDEVKKLLDIPDKHYVATVTPVGYPAESPEPKTRCTVDQFVRDLG